MKMSEFNSEDLINKVLKDFDFSKVPHVFSVEDTVGYVTSLLEEAIWMAGNNVDEYVEVKMDEWVAQALHLNEGVVLVSLMYATESATARYLDGVYV